MRRFNVIGLMGAAALLAACSSNVEQSAASSSTAPASTEEIRQAQSALHDQGLYRGPVDGIAGPQTQQAVSEFQRRQGLPQTAALDRRTLDAITGSMAALPPERGPSTPQ